MLRKQVPLLLLAVCPFCLWACKEQKQPPRRLTPEAPVAQDLAPPPRVPTTSGELDGGAASKVAVRPKDVGIPECDRYLEKHYRCITKHMPEQMRALALAGLGSSVRAWREAVHKGSDIARLRLACELTTKQSGLAMARYGCTY